MAKKPARNEYTRGIAALVAEFRCEAVPAEVVDRIKSLVLDFLGCPIFGAELESSRVLRRTLAQLETSQGCGAWGTR